MRCTVTGKRFLADMARQERMSEQLRARPSFAIVLSQALVQEIAQTLRVAQLSVVEFRRLIISLTVHSHRVCDQLVQCHTKRPHVSFLVVNGRRMQPFFGRIILFRANDFGRKPALFFAVVVAVVLAITTTRQCNTTTEIAQLDVACGMNQDIVRFHIVEYEFVRMNGAQRTRHRKRNIFDMSDVQSAIESRQIVQIHVFESNA
mmetsp:Transcript_32719/g.53090  ORF Transcript_32719/g.53090 Transcript_32719/m.53090 type:complete len:204 (+) Transcript_32719:177-788(+)